MAYIWWEGSGFVQAVISWEDLMGGILVDNILHPCGHDNTSLAHSHVVCSVGS